MTPAEFNQKCKDICPHCADGIPLRQREDTKEWCHDGAIQISGTLGRRQSHAICLANDFRNKEKIDV
jgi:hypothetical protein